LSSASASGGAVKFNCTRENDRMVAEATEGGEKEERRRERDD